ncbi:hypothetical protein GOV09_04905 [Candidatus Woesearchaeota archaeon]|nr:hypothetical protein [Candidatus Woesearchaeota archaeon]
MKNVLLTIIVSAIVLFAGCQAQEGQPTDVSFVPIDEISVEDFEIEDIEVEDLEMEDLEEEEFMEELEEEAMEDLEEEEFMEELEEEVMEFPGEIVIIVEETELVNLQPVAVDPDQDTLIFTYSNPLNDNGLWQTTYGDAGEYTITITASDGELTSSKDALLLVNKREEAPTIGFQAPEGMEQSMLESTDLEFEVTASDLNSDPLDFEWKFDGVVVSDTDSFAYTADFNSAGSHTVKLEVTDGTSVVTLLWSVTVVNVDRPPALKLIPDITIKETDTVVITPEASDPDGDEIVFAISDPIGDSGVWETTYDDAGIYTVEITASDGEMEDSQEVKVTVINVNRAPVIEDIVQIG